ncbi:MAG TPA: flagellin [Azospirillaceae bacterium]|nr:flagellin [Azospirillaceae bacterium]
MVDTFRLPAGMRSSLLLLQSTQAKVDRTVQALSTGYKINSALDNPTAWFAARGLIHRADGLTSLKDAMSQAISTIKAADKGISAIESLIEQARGLAVAAYGSLDTDEASIATRQSLARQFDRVRAQIDTIAYDSGYQGKNLLAGSGRRVDSWRDPAAGADIAGVDRVRVTNGSTARNYSVQVEGSGAISAVAGDIARTEEARGLTGLTVSGHLDSGQGSFADVTIATGGSLGRQRTVTISDGKEARAIRAFDNSQSLTAAVATPAAAGQGKTATVTVGGVIEAGDTFQLAIAGRAVIYKAQEGDTSAEVTAGLAGRIAADLALSGITVNTDAASGRLTLAGSAARGDFTLAATTENALTRRVSETFSSGTVVAFTLDRKRMEAAVNAGNGTSVLEKNVDVRVAVRDDLGASVVRDGRSARGEGKLAMGENAFTFAGGTVRVTVNPKTILASALKEAGSGVRTQVSAPPDGANDLTVIFNDNRTSTLTVEAQDLTTQGLKLDAAANGWMDRADIDRAMASLDFAKATARGAAQMLSTNLNIITTRETYAREFADVLVEGANKLLLADRNEEAAKLLMLQTRQQLGILTLSLAAQSQRSILQLF